ncbi:hypothetical protein AAVH_23137 [Aphelenchoides avenae]|nr:hypothetical protein AAVH_23137 [Aphelenchus avenae]
MVCVLPRDACGHPKKLCNFGGNLNGACNAESERSGEPQMHPATMFSQLGQTANFDNATRAAFAACVDYFMG